MQAQQPKPTGYQPTGPNYFTSVQIQPGQQQSVGTPGSNVTSPLGGGAAAKKPAGGDAFASLLSGSGMKKSSSPAPKGMTIADMAKQKSQAGLYGANAPSMPTTQPAAKPNTGAGGSALDDLLG
jgi:epsin